MGRTISPYRLFENPDLFPWSVFKIDRPTTYCEFYLYVARALSRWATDVKTQRLLRGSPTLSQLRRVEDFAPNPGGLISIVLASSSRLAAGKWPALSSEGRERCLLDILMGFEPARKEIIQKCEELHASGAINLPDEVWNDT